jgi:hypothetical protein
MNLVELRNKAEQAAHDAQEGQRTPEAAILAAAAEDAYKKYNEAVIKDTHDNLLRFADTPGKVLFEACSMGYYPGLIVLDVKTSADTGKPFTSYEIKAAKEKPISLFALENAAKQLLGVMPWKTALENLAEHMAAAKYKNIGATPEQLATFHDLYRRSDAAKKEGKKDLLSKTSLEAELQRIADLMFGVGIVKVLTKDANFIDQTISSKGGWCGVKYMAPKGFVDQVVQAMYTRIHNGVYEGKYPKVNQELQTGTAPAEIPAQDKKDTQKKGKGKKAPAAAESAPIVADKPSEPSQGKEKVA